MVLAKRIGTPASFQEVIAENQATIAGETVVTHVLVLTHLRSLARDERSGYDQGVGTVRAVAKPKQMVDRFAQLPRMALRFEFHHKRVLSVIGPHGDGEIGEFGKMRLVA